MIAGKNSKTFLENEIEKTKINKNRECICNNQVRSCSCRKQIIGNNGKAKGNTGSRDDNLSKSRNDFLINLLVLT